MGWGMDAVMFHLKGAHLAAQRVGRGLLRRFGLTPARFDLMHAVAATGMRQSDLWKRLGVVRSVVCEMVRSLEVLGWVKRVRAVDSRTWTVQLTRRGREVFERAYARWVESGDASLYMDAALTGGHVESDAQEKRLHMIYACDDVHAAFRTQPGFFAPELYPWHPEDYYFMLTNPDEPPGRIPFVTA